MPLFTEGEDEEKEEATKSGLRHGWPRCPPASGLQSDSGAGKGVWAWKVLERCAPRDYPRRPRWEEMKIPLRRVSDLHVTELLVDSGHLLVIGKAGSEGGMEGVA